LSNDQPALRAVYGDNADFTEHDKWLEDWTWVLQHPCPECGLDTQSFPRSAIAGMIRANAAAWHDVLARSGNARRRPSPGLTEAAEAIAARFGTVAGAQWQRTGARSDGAHFTVESFARYFIHDPVHHLCDVTGTSHADPDTRS
jgi:hypothetical protein